MLSHLILNKLKFWNAEKEPLLGKHVKMKGSDYIHVYEDSHAISGNRFITYPNTDYDYFLTEGEIKGVCQADYDEWGKPTVLKTYISLKNVKGYWKTDDNLSIERSWLDLDDCQIIQTGGGCCVGYILSFAASLGMRW